MYSQKRLSQLSHALECAYANEYSDFYRNLPGYKSHEIRSQQSWEKVPILGREQIASVPATQRTFVPKADAPLIMSTSGTTGRGVVYLPRKLQRTGPRLFPHARTALGFRAAFETGDFAQHPRTIYAEASRLEIAARLAALEGVDAIDGAATILIDFAQHFGRIADCGSIRFIALHADRCSQLQLIALRRLYPNARIENWMSITEFTGYVAFSPESIPETNPLLLTPHADVHLEIVDEKGALVAPGEVGDLLVTSLTPEHAFHIIRYRGNDRARLVAIENDVMLFETVARSSEERIKIPRGEIQVVAIDTALVQLNEARIIDFEAMIGETEEYGAIRTSLTIALYTTQDFTEDELVRVATRIEKNLLINQERTYADGVIHGLYMPLQCTKGEGTGKRRRLVDTR